MKNKTTTMLVSELKRFAIEKQRPLWKRIAQDLEAPTRHRRIINLWKLEQQAKEGDTIIVPGKVLGDGALTKKVTVGAAGYSADAKKKLAASGSKALTIKELMEQHPDGKNIKILG